ncbi:immunoglobulin-like domain-containing protein [Clostridium sp. LP20]|uniref:immunoglobulin-like domain-containing protein n=1 Tax=Clostridium sp. LP20 TaxID=3418665 RepID=UPI003EE7DC19
MVKGLIKKVVAITIASSVIFSGLGLNSMTKVSAGTVKTDFGVGKGVSWPDQVCAPFVDLCEYHTDDGYNISGAPYLPKLAEDTGLRFFNVSFIQAASKEIVDGKVDWAWAGLSVLSEKSKDEQYLGMKQSIKDLRAMGGDVAISFGGLNGVALWQATNNVDILAATYKEIVDGYGLTRLDLDIEEGGQDKEENRINARAIKKVQNETGVDVVLTLPVLPSGLTETQLNVLEVYLTEGVDVKLVNIMAMCFGAGALNPGENYGTGSVRAIDSTMKQIKEYYKKFKGVLLTEKDAYRKVGVTTSVGYEAASEPIFGPDWSKLVTDHAIEKGIGMNSFWSLNRDSKLQANSGINKKYEHTDECKRFGTTEIIENYEPVIKGVNDKKIKVGTSFNPLSGVSATDREDGDLTSKIKVTGNVNINIAGVYKLTYTVIDSGGKVITIERKITVTNEDIKNYRPILAGVESREMVLEGVFLPLEGITANDIEDGEITDKITYSGAVDTKKVGDYIITYSITDSDGATSTRKALIRVIKESDYAEEFHFESVYTEGQLVIYNGIKYKCTGWSTYEYPDVAVWSWVSLGKVQQLPDPNENEIIDLAYVASKYNLLKGDGNYDITCDMNNDGIIDIYDVVIVSRKI